MNPLRAILSAFQNYGSLDGRASRSEYWWFYSFFVALLVAIFVASIAWKPALLSVWVAYLFLMTPPLCPVTVRRLHDVGRPGTWALLGFLPLAGGPRMTRVLSRPGTVGPNLYGADPLRPELGVRRSQWLPDVPPAQAGGATTESREAQTTCARCGKAMPQATSYCPGCGGPQG